MELLKSFYLLPTNLKERPWTATTQKDSQNAAKQALY